MKNIGRVLLMCVALVNCKGNENKPADSAMATTNKQNQELKRYETESGSISYESVISGKVMGSTITGSGTESLHFKNWGAIEVKEEESSQTTTMSVFGNKSTETTSTHTMHKLDNGKSYTVDFKRKEIREMDDMAMGMTKMFQKDADAGKVGKELFESMGGKLVGSEEILGYECEIWDLMGIKQWLYKGVLLKSEATVMGIKTRIVATSAKFNGSVPEARFKLPDFSVIETESFMGNESFDVDMDEMQEDMDRMKNMSYQDWKKLVTADDAEMQAMSEEELKQMYDMMQKMLQMRQ